MVGSLVAYTKKAQAIRRGIFYKLQTTICSDWRGEYYKYMEQNKPLTKDVMLDIMNLAQIEELYKEGIAQAINAAGAIVQTQDGEAKFFNVLGFMSANLPGHIQSCFAPKPCDDCPKQ